MVQLSRTFPFVHRDKTEEQIKKEKQEGVVVGLGYTRPSRIKPTFNDMIQYYLCEPPVKASIDELAESCVGHGFWLSAENDDALAYAEEWCEHIDLDGMNQIIARELWATGNNIEEMQDPPPDLAKIVSLPISSFVEIKTDIYGNPLYYKQEIDNNRHYFVSPSLKLFQQEKQSNINRLIHFRWNAIEGGIRGYGLLEPLLRDGLGYTWIDAGKKEHTEYRPSIREIIEENQDSIRKILHRYVPRHVYKFLGLADESVTAHAAKIQNLRPEDDVVIGLPNKTTQSLEVDRISTDPRSRLDPFFEYFYLLQITAMETPSTRLFLEAGFTEASARTALDVLNRKVEAFRRFLKRREEAELIKPYVMQQMKWEKDWQWQKAKVRINWGAIEPPKLSIDALVSLADTTAKSGIQYMPPETMHKLLKNWYGIDVIGATEQKKVKPKEIEKEGTTNE